MIETSRAFDHRFCFSPSDHYTTNSGAALSAIAESVSPSDLAKSVLGIETAPGVKLFHRTTRLVSLTPDGERLDHHCQRILAEVVDLQDEASGARSAPAGTLIVHAPNFYGKHFVMPVLAELAGRYPALDSDMRLSDTPVDLIREGGDLPVRMGPLRDSTLVARRVDKLAIVLCASPACLVRHATPRRIDEQSGQAAIAFRLPTSGRDRTWQLRQRGMDVELMPSPRFRVNESEGLLLVLVSTMER